MSSLFQGQFGKSNSVRPPPAKTDVYLKRTLRYPAFTGLPQSSSYSLFVSYLFHILQSFFINLSGADLDDLHHIIDEDLAVADMTGVESSRRCMNDVVNRNL